MAERGKDHVANVKHSLNRRTLLKSGAAVAGGAIGATALSRTAAAAPSVKKVTLLRRQADQVTIRFMTHNTLEEPAGTILKEMIAEFEEANPSIRIQVEEVPNADVLTKLTAYAEANDLPDLIDGQFGLASFISLDAAMDITEMVDRENLREAFFPAALQASTDGEGRILGLPLYTGTDALYYRTDYFEEAGLPGPPTTWDELADYAVELTNARSARFGFGMYGRTHTMRVVHFMQNNGDEGNMLRLLRDQGEWEILVNSPDSIGAIDFMVRLALEYQCVPPNVVENDYPANISLFAGGNLAMLTTGPWGVQTIINANPDIEGTFTVAPHPTPTGEPPVLRQGSLVYAIGRTSEHPEEAFQFLKWITHDRQTYFAASAGYGPTTVASLDDPQIQNDEYLGVFVEQAANAVVEPYEVELPEWNRMKDLFDPEFQAALLGQRSVEEAMNNAALGFQDVLGDRSILKYPVG